MKIVNYKNEEYKVIGGHVYKVGIKVTDIDLFEAVLAEAEKEDYKEIEVLTTREAKARRQKHMPKTTYGWMQMMERAENNS